MKTPALFVLIGLLIISCEKDNNGNSPNTDGFEIYRTKTTYRHEINKDYSIVDLDTIVLEDTPIFRYRDLIKYDTSSHKLSIGISHDSLKFDNTSVYGSMFVVTLDKNPIYCGFYWLMISSVPCNWVYILEPYYELDSLEDNEIVIGFNYNSSYWQKYPDPRLDTRIVDRLIEDGKIE